MQALIVEFVIRPGFEDAFERAIVANAAASLAEEPGCRQFDVCRDAANARRFMLYELYDDEAAIAAHLRSPHFLAMNEATAAWFEAKTVWRCARIAPR